MISISPLAVKARDFRCKTAPDPAQLSCFTMNSFFVFLAYVGICLAQVVPEPKPAPGVRPVRQVIPEPKLIPEVRQVSPEPKLLIPKILGQVVPETKQSGRMCNSRFSFTNVGPQGVLESPNYPNAYTNNYDMVICLASPPGTRISISCNNFNLENSASCAYDKLYLSLTGDLEFRDEVKFCGNVFPTQTSTANSLIIGFHTDNSVVLSGYQCSITVLNVPTTTTPPPTTTAPSTLKTCTSRMQLTAVGQAIDISSPGYPNPYPNNVDQVQCFSSPPGTKMAISCNPFNLEYQTSCAWDKLYLSLSGDLGFRDEKKFCGTDFTDQTTTSNQLNVGFKTDASVQNPGYKCTVRVVSDSVGPTPPPASTPDPDLCECGLRNMDARIVNGTQAKPAEFPWRCYLRTDSYDFFCGCSVISNNWILTARHCTAAVEGVPITVVVGAHRRNQVGPNQRSVRVDRIVDHPGYNRSTQDNDVSLLHLSSPLTYNHDVSPVCIPWHLAAKNFSGTTVTASGWGTDQSGGNVQNTLMEVDLPVLTTEECQGYYGSSITQNMICTYEPGKDTCQGDSGGSIDYLDSARNGYYGIGVVSWGIGCAGKNAPGVYAKVTKYLRWIETSTQGEQFCRK